MANIWNVIKYVALILIGGKVLGLLGAISPILYLIYRKKYIFTKGFVISNKLVKQITLAVIGGLILFGLLGRIMDPSRSHHYDRDTDPNHEYFNDDTYDFIESEVESGDWYNE